MELVLASTNPHKAKELTEIFDGVPVRLPTELGVEYAHEERADSFSGNAFDKATSLHGALQRTLGRTTAKGYSVISDDSGICVTALGGRPGVYSARYGDPTGTKGLDDGQRNQMLLSEMEGIEERDAYFVCAMVLLHSPERFTIAQETWCGQIAHSPSSGRGGFGYDPLFYLPELGCSAADLPTERKNELSHRGRASRTIRAVLGLT